MTTLSLEECELLGDSKYRAYISQVEKTLKNFEYTSEWADLISALGKLNKVLLNHVKYPVIPKRVTIGKRLAQCLHPALPSGVHLKALETYDIIFKCIGTQRLSNDLFTYCAGIFPLLGHAAMSVKPSLLMLYESHFVPLGKHIKPALTGLITGLLPGLEEGSEHFERTRNLLDEFCESATPVFFFGCLWECVLTNPSIRLPAVNYVLANFNRKLMLEDQIHFAGTNLDVLVQALCVAVQDSSVLVQRSTLDFLLLGFPLHHSQLVKSDLARIVTDAIKVVLRRDMSLNRRLYAWLLGTDANGQPIHIQIVESKPNKMQRSDSISTTSESDMFYFNTYSKELLIQAVRTCIKEGMSSEHLMAKSINLRPFRILISLLDKPEIGSVIVEDVLMDILRCLYQLCIQTGEIQEETQSNRQSRRNRNGRPHPERLSSTEVIKTANLLFGSFEPFFIWEFIARSFENACLRTANYKPDKEALSVIELCCIVDFLLEKISLEAYAETQTVHLPELLRQVTGAMSASCDTLHESEIEAGLKLCSKMLARVMPSIVPASRDEFDLQNDASASDTDLIENSGTNEQDNHSDVEKINGKFEPVDGNSIENNEIEKEVATPDTEGTIDIIEDILVEQAEDALESDKISQDFSEFVQFDAESTLPKFKISPMKSPRKKDLSEMVPQTLMQACLHSYQNLFVVFVTKKMLLDPDAYQMLLEQLLTPSNASWCKDYQRCESSDGTNYYSDGSPSHIQDGSSLRVSRLSLNHLSPGLCEAFAVACQLLVDFSCFPMYCTGHAQVPVTGSSRGQDISRWPEWLQLLLTCVCFVDNFYMQSSAISSILDLISLTRSVDPPADIDGERRHSDGTVSVVIVPALSHQHLDYLNKHTKFYQIVTFQLWNYLSDETPSNHSRSAELLHQLHQLAPNPWICEDVIGQSLVSDDLHTQVQAHKKFAILWHILRSQKPASNMGVPAYSFDREDKESDLRDFTRSMFVMLDSLQSDTHPCRVLTQTWLTHAIQRGDITRILEPLLLLLLHPDTAKISVQHVNIHTPRKVRLSESNDDNSPSETKIYAISSEGGNIIYHVSNQGTKPISQKTSDNLRSYALTAMADGTHATKMARVKGDTELSFEKVNPNDLNLRVNPFGSESSIDRLGDENSDNGMATLQEIQRAKRLDAQTCKKEGIAFGDGNNEVDEDDEDTALLVEDTAETIVKDILEKLLSKISYGDPEVVLEGLTESSSRTRLRLSSSQSRDSLAMGSEDLLNAIDSKVSEIDSQSEASLDLGNGTKDVNQNETPRVHPLHTHILLYTQKYDAQRTLHGLACLNGILNTSPRLVVCAMATTNLSSTQSPLLPKIQNLLARHRRSVFGKNFFSDVPHDTVSSYRTSMYIEIFLSLALYYIRSYYPNLMMSKLTLHELNVNKEVQILSAEILIQLLTEIVNVAKDSGRGFASYMNDLLVRCKVQKVLLHCILASVYNSRRRMAATDESVFTQALISFNEENMDSNTNETFQVKLLRLLLVVIILEDQIKSCKADGTSASGSQAEWETTQVTFQPSLSSVRYLQGRAMVHQSMLLTAILSALKQQHQAHMHHHWVATVTAALPYMGKALSHVVVAVVNQLCKNLEWCGLIYENMDRHSRTNLASPTTPPDYVIVLLEGLTTLCHYCMLDSGQQVATGTPFPSVGTVVNDTSSAGQIFSNLMHVFNPYNSGRELIFPDPWIPSRETSPAKDSQAAANSPVLEARRNLLSHLPRILASLSIMWKATKTSEQTKGNGKGHSCWAMGHPKNIRHYILEFASPISLHHGVNLMGSLAVVWNDRKCKSNNMNKKVITEASNGQLLLVDIVSSIKVLPMDTLIQTIKEVIKHPPPTSNDKNKKRTPLEVSMLQLFFAYIRKMDGEYLVDSWPTLLSLLREGLQLSLAPPGLFLLLGILNEFVQKIPLFEERKDQKDLQEITQKLLEASSDIAGASLEQTTWLRRNLAVKPGPQVDVAEADGEELRHNNEELPSPTKAEPSQPADINLRQYSVQALVLLADLIAPLLDIVYRSEEKDKVVPLLYSVMSNVFPYLRNHSTHNLPSYKACSQILASLSGYMYTRKAWKKEAFDLLLDNMFFQTDECSIKSWHTTIDNLMTHDKTTFKDLLARVVITQGGSLNLFSSKEQEFEQRAQLLKRLAYTIYCSEPDQYNKFMPEVQERLADSLRLPQVPSIQAQVFLFFRVLVLRMSPQHLTSLWPTIITELVQVLLQIEQELCPDAEETKPQKKNVASRAQLAKIANLDATWAMGNGLNAHGNPAWLQLYLAACKLLDLALVLEAEELPQFQVYRWAFVGDPGVDQKKKRKEMHGFTPHVIRIAKLMELRFGQPPCLLLRPPGCLRLTVAYISSLKDLHSFFHTLVMVIKSPESVTTLKSKTSSKAGTHKAKSDYVNGRTDQEQDQHAGRQLIEDIVEADYLETMPSS